MKKCSALAFKDVITPQFASTSKEPTPAKVEISLDHKIEIQAKLLTETYGKAVFRTKDVMKVLGIGEKKARKLMASGKLKAVPDGASWFVSAVDLAKYTLGIST